MGERAYKEAAYGAVASVAAALAAPLRAELLELVAQREWTVAEIAGEVQTSIPNASRHLAALARAGLVRSRRSATSRFYRSSSSESVRALDALRALVPAPPQAPPCPLDAPGLRVEIASGATLVDVRPADEFRWSHLPGAISLPLEELEQGARRRLPRRKALVVYCRGPYCTFADEAVRKLRLLGFNARRAEVSPAQWEALGGDVVRSG